VIDGKSIDAHARLDGSGSGGRYHDVQLFRSLDSNAAGRGKREIENQGKAFLD
jgi:hypothetical protein